MYRYYLIYVDGVDGYDEWNCNVAEENDGFAMTEKEMFEHVRQSLLELGGGHADILDAETDELFVEIEI
jgi:hypothetical protein